MPRLADRDRNIDAALKELMRRKGYGSDEIRRALKRLPRLPAMVRKRGVKPIDDNSRLYHMALLIAWERISTNEAANRIATTIPGYSRTATAERLRSKYRKHRLPPAVVSRIRLGRNHPKRG